MRDHYWDHLQARWVPCPTPAGLPEPREGDAAEVQPADVQTSEAASTPAP